MPWPRRRPGAASADPRHRPGGALSPVLERVLYVSRAATAADRGLYAIIRAAHQHNPADGVTGALILLDGRFVQMLEGPAAGLAARLAPILADPRHRDIDLRLHERALCRLLPGQPMALRTRSCLDPEHLAGFDYRPGFPTAVFPADILLEFVVQACRMQGCTRHAAPRRAARS